MAFQTILYSVDEAIATIALNRPDKLNAMNGQLIEELDQALVRAEADAEVRVIIIKGVGRAFSTGVDLTEGHGGAPGVTSDRERLQGNLQKLLRIWDLGKPVIAQVHGYCIAGGTMLPIFCDITVVSRECRIRWPGIPVGGGYISPLWTWLVGPKKAKEMSFIAGSEMTGEEAWHYGWANHAVPEAQIEDFTLNMARRITRTPADLLRLKKLAINRVVDIQGFRSAVMFGAEWDSISHASDGADEIRAKIRDMGLKEAIKWFSAD